jgi:hypothetical protein
MEEEFFRGISLLRGSHERLLIVPIDGKQIQEAVQSNSFSDLIESAWNRATMN